MDKPHINLTISLLIPCTDTEDMNALVNEDTPEGIRTAIARHYLSKFRLSGAEVNYAYIYDQETTNQISVEGLEIDDILNND